MSLPLIIPLIKLMVVAPDQYDNSFLAGGFYTAPYTYYDREATLSMHYNRSVDIGGKGVRVQILHCNISANEHAAYLGNVMGVLLVVPHSASTHDALQEMESWNTIIENYAPKGVKKLLLGLWPRSQSEKHWVRSVRGEDVRTLAEKLGMKYMELDPVSAPDSTSEPINILLRDVLQRLSDIGEIEQERPSSKETVPNSLPFPAAQADSTAISQTDGADASQSDTIDRAINASYWTGYWTATSRVGSDSQTNAGRGSAPTNRGTQPNSVPPSAQTDYNTAGPSMDGADVQAQGDDASERAISASYWTGYWTAISRAQTRDR